MNWLFVSLFGYFLNAVAFVISKVILRDFKTLKPAAYSFWVNFLGIAVFLLIPFHFIFPKTNIIIAAFFSGFFNVLALLIFYNLLYKEEVSQVAPLTGGFAPIFVFILASLFLGEILSFNQILGFFIIVIGGIIASYEISLLKHIHYLNKKLLVGAIFSGFCFAMSQILVKYIFNNIDFFDGFIIRGLGAFLASLTLLFYPPYFKQIKESLVSQKEKKAKSALAFLVSQFAGFLSFVLINYAIYLNSVSLVNALSGAQYVFLFILVIILSLFYPRILKEDLDKSIIKQKIVSIFMIGGGVFLLFL